MTVYDRNNVEGQSYQISAGPLDLSFLANLPAAPEPFTDGRQIPWNDPEFSRRMLAVHLDESHDWASRRAGKRGRIVDELMALTGLQPGDSVLDLGCGPGLYCQELAERGLRVEGWDYAPAAIEYGRERSTAAGMEIRYVREDYRNLNVTERFDMVTLIYGDLNVFSRSDAAALLRRVYYALRPGGFFYTDVTSPAAHPIREITRNFTYHSSGLWSDEPYLELYEAHPVDADGLRWERYVIIDADAGRGRVYTTWSQEYSSEAITDLLKEAGFAIGALYDDPTESALCESKGWIGVLAQKPSQGK
jgi:SAM-dependent methyltransferase